MALKGPQEPHIKYVDIHPTAFALIEYTYSYFCLTLQHDELSTTPFSLCNTTWQWSPTFINDSVWFESRGHSRICSFSMKFSVGLFPYPSLFQLRTLYPESTSIAEDPRGMVILVLRDSYSHQFCSGAREAWCWRACRYPANDAWKGA